jgi:hypothetical protein
VYRIVQLQGSWAKRFHMLDYRMQALQILKTLLDRSGV